MVLKKLIQKLFFIPRSLAGSGNRETIKILSLHCGRSIKIKYFKSNTKFGNWKVPKEWSVKKAVITDSKKKKIIDFKRNNLELVINSDSYRGTLTKNELIKKIFTLKNNPNAIPYITNYYAKNFWSVCMKYKDFKKLKNEKYFVDIKTSKKNGKMNYGEFFIKGKSNKEIVFTTYICHPQMANNELSGPAVMVDLINNIKKYLKKKKPTFSYRFLFLPETIGSIAYINSNFSSLKKKVFAGFVVTCVGTSENFKLVLSPHQNTLADDIAKQALTKIAKKKWETRSFLTRGSDERQWCSPAVNLPFVSICRSKYGEYNEYHTSLDDLNFINEKGLKQSQKLYFEIFKIFENSKFYFSKSIGEPKLDKYGFYPKISSLKTRKAVKNIMNIVAYCNGNRNEYQISKNLNLNIKITNNILKKLEKKKIIFNKYNSKN